MHRIEAAIENADLAPCRKTRHRIQMAASKVVRRAVRRGELVKAARCYNCGRVRPLVAYHHSYAYRYWLQVAWMCRPCRWERTA